MGHKKVAAKPGPLKLLAILAAVERGMNSKTIAERTHYARSSISRWHQEFSDDAEWAAEILMYLPEKQRQSLLLENHLPAAHLLDSFVEAARPRVSSHLRLLGNP